METNEKASTEGAVPPSEATEPPYSVSLDDLIGREDRGTESSPDSASGVDRVKLCEILCAFDPNMPQGGAEIMERYQGISGRQLSRCLAALVSEGLGIVDQEKYVLTEGGKVAQVIRSS